MSGLTPDSPAYTPATTTKPEIVHVAKPEGWNGPWQEDLQVERFENVIRCQRPDQQGSSLTFRGETREARLQEYLAAACAGFPIEVSDKSWWLVRQTSRPGPETTPEIFNPQCHYWTVLDSQHGIASRVLLELGGKFAHRSESGLWEEISADKAHALITEHGWTEEQPKTAS